MGASCTARPAGPDAALGDRFVYPVRRHLGAKGLAYIKVNDRALGRVSLQSPIIRTARPGAGARSSNAPRTGRRLSFFGARPRQARGAIWGRCAPGSGIPIRPQHGLFEAGWRRGVVIDFPMFRVDEGEQRWVSAHIRSRHRRTGTMITSNPTRAVPCQGLRP